MPHMKLPSMFYDFNLCQRTCYLSGSLKILTNFELLHFLMFREDLPNLLTKSYFYIIMVVFLHIGMDKSCL